MSHATPPDPYTLPELIAAMRAEAARVAQQFAHIPADRFFDGDSERWSPAHHLEHLTLAHTMIARALRAGSRLPAHTGAPPRRYAAMAEALQSALAAAPREFLAANPFAATVPTGSGVLEIVQRYESANAQLCANAGEWSEHELDARTATHPLLGPIPMREMLMFVVLHDAHHRRGVARRLGP